MRSLLFAWMLLFSGFALAQSATDDFCTQHPDLNICQDSTVTGDPCAPVCDGDAIMCTMLKLQAALSCEDNTANAQSALGEAALGGADPDKATLPSPDNAEEIEVPKTLDKTGWLGGGQCFQDIEFDMMGQPVRFSFEEACKPLLGLRYALMIASLLMAFRMLSNVMLGV